MKISLKQWVCCLFLLWTAYQVQAQCPSDDSSTSGVIPEQIAWNPPGDQDCQNYSFYRLEPITSGVYPLPAGGSVTITVTNTACGPAFSVVGNSVNLFSIAVKGGPDSVNVYDYNSPIVNDGNLHSVHNPNNGQWYGLSHIDFCYEFCECVLTCPADIDLDCNDSTDPAITGAATSSGNCSPITYSDVIVPGSCATDYTIERTWSTTNNCTNTTETCTQTIAISDDTPPVVSCPSDVTVSCGDDTDPSATGTATASDDCSGYTVSYSDTSSGNTCLTTITRTWTASDDCGNTSNCTQTIEISDDTPPIISCPADVTISCGDNTNPSATGTPAVSDDCNSYTVTFLDSNGGSTCLSDILRTWVATDDCGNTSSCDQLIQISDDNPPVILCPADVTIACGDSTDPTSTGTATATDDCSNVLVTFMDGTSDEPCDAGGGILRTWTATDDCGNTSTCTQLIAVVDNTPPVINCPQDIEITCAQEPLPVVCGTPVATDDCSGVNVTYTDIQQNAGCIFDIQRTWMATDNCGNTSTCVQSIEVSDEDAPEITCPVDVDVNCGLDLDLTFTGEATATDICSDFDITYLDQSSGSGCDITVVRTWTATDDCGNASSCVQNISLNDNEAPVIECPLNTTVQCGEATDISVTGIATATDNCGSVQVSHEDAGSTNLCDDGGLERIWTAIDDCGNTSSCVQLISMTDDEAPIIECPDDVTINCGDDDCPTQLGEPIATDNCDVDLVVYHQDQSTGNPCSNDGGIQRVWTAMDDCGNTSSCTQVITVIDDIAPVFDEDWTPGCDMVMTATDNCDEEVEITCTTGPIVEANCQKTQVVTYIATDDCGNTAERAITLSWTTTFDNEPPVVECPADIVLEDGASAYPDETGWATSEAGAVITYRDELSACGGEILRIWTATDACGNAASCTQILECNCAEDLDDHDDKLDVNQEFDRSEQLDQNFKFDLKSYPNPTTDALHMELEIPNPDQVLLQLFDVNGALVKTILAEYVDRNVKHVSYQLNQLPAGTYLLQLTVGAKVFTHQVIKQ